MNEFNKGSVAMDQQ